MDNKVSFIAITQNGMLHCQEKRKPSEFLQVVKVETKSQFSPNQPLMREKSLTSVLAGQTPG